MTADAVFLFGKFTIAMLFAIGGIIALVFGNRHFRGRGGREREGTIISWKALKVTVGTVGGLVMLTASFWGWLAYEVAPKQLTQRQDGNEIKISSELPENQTVLVSVGAGSGAERFLECRKDRDLVCFPLPATGRKCGDPPKIQDGLGRLQVSAVPYLSPEGQAETIRNQRRQLQGVLANRKAQDWSRRLMQYHALEDEKVVSRLVFNGVPPEVAKPMCSWLACEGWTFGPCMLVPKPERAEETLNWPESQQQKPVEQTTEVRPTP